MWQDSLPMRLARGVLARLRGGACRPGFRCSIISASPVILHVKEFMDRDFLENELGSAPVHFLTSFAWSCEDAQRLGHIRRTHDAHVRKHPHHRFTFLCNTPAELARVQEQGLAAAFCPSNSLVDENIFQIDPSIQKSYDAVYDAQLDKFKRHELAVEIRSLGLMAYLRPGSDLATAREIRRMLSHAHWFNDPLVDAIGSFLEPNEVSRCYNMCRVGLCLSAIEGQMYASIQYLLCGLPVVTTRNVGGRDLFFDPEYVIWVDDTPQAVREGVRQAIDRNVPAERIREQTLKRIQAYRDGYIGLVQKIYDEAGVGRKFADEWSSRFFNKMVKFHSRESIVESISAGERK